MALRLVQLAERLAVELRGPGDVDITGVATLARAGPGELSFLSNPRYRRFLAETAAAAVILSEADAPAAPGAVLVTDNPYAAFAKAVALFHPPSPPRRGIHPAACVDATAEIDPSAWVDAQCVIGARARIAAGVQVGPACIVGPGVSIAEHSVLSARVTLSAGCRLGARVLLHPGVVIGSDGFGLAQSDGQWHKVPQVGSVVIGDDVEIGANTTVDRGALDDTCIGTGVKIDNQVQIAHNVTIGAHTAIAACVGISGSTRIGSHCTLAGGVGVVGHLEIADNVHITCMSMVTHSIRRPGRYSSGTPLTDNVSWRRNAVRIKQLDQLCRRVDKLEKTKKNK